MTVSISPTQDLVDDIRRGRMIVLADAEDRENEGDLVMAADFVTPEAINFMATHARGLICLTLTEERCRQLDLPLMVNDNRSPLGTAFTVSIEAASGVTTGISAAGSERRSSTMTPSFSRETMRIASCTEKAWRAESKSKRSRETKGSCTRTSVGRSGAGSPFTSA